MKQEKRRASGANSTYPKGKELRNDDSRRYKWCWICHNTIETGVVLCTDCNKIHCSDCLCPMVIKK